jgi:hypothetical protein
MDIGATGRMGRTDHMDMATPILTENTPEGTEGTVGTEGTEGTEGTGATEGIGVTGGTEGMADMDITDGDHGE